MINNLIRQISGLLILFSFCSCAGTDTGMFEQALSSTGLVSGGQASALFRFGSSISDGVKGFTPEEEYYLGRSVSATILSKYKPYNNQTLNQYASKIANVLVSVSDKPETFSGYRVMILDTPEINAVSAPGGFIFISRGFVSLLPNEDAFAAVIAHEIAHIAMNHGTKAISESNISSAFLALGKETAQARTGAITSQLTSVFGDSVTDITNTLLEKGFSRSQEYDADQYAITLLTRAGYNPVSLETALSAISTTNGKKDSGGWMSTHPAPLDRIERLGKKIKSKEDAGYSVRTARFKKVAPKSTR
ncbi:MAG TPA: M48 family metalloprotease [Oligoflexia bacterium]|mgnify:CR=1 FL=1|nr:M48 family metalloprotease [Oligoflexia bacterium]HMP49208.1 M48 family metalloprotease [Oligoflexia bacterium]